MEHKSVTPASSGVWLEAVIVDEGGAVEVGERFYLVVHPRTLS